MNKLTLSSLAIALALSFSAPVFAGDVFLLKVSDNKHYWTIDAPNSRFTQAEFQAKLDKAMVGIDYKDPTSMPQILAGIYEAEDAAFVSIAVTGKNLKQETRIIRIVESEARVAGSFAEYFPGARNEGGKLVARHVKRSQLEGFARKVNDRARADFSRATINVSQDGEESVLVDTKIEVIPDAKRFQGSLGYTNNGARYAGKDLLSGSMRFQLGHGNELAINASRGLPNVREESYGGRYNSAGAAFSHAGAKGTTRVAVSHVDYLTGGPLRVFDLSGKIDTISVFHTAPMGKNWSVYGGVTATRASTNLGAGGLDWSDTTKYRTATAGFTRQGKATVLNVQVDKGIGGSREMDFVPLQGDFDPNYTSLKVDFQGQKALGSDGWMLRAGASGQISSKGTPSNELFTIGGPTRGTAYQGGAASGNKGYSVFGEVSAPERRGFTPYAGLDRSVVSPAVGDNLSLNSAYIGTRFKSPKSKVNFDVGYAHSIGSAPEGLDGSRVFATATWNF